MGRFRISKVIDIVSAEFLLSYRPNGGTVIILRTIWITAILYSTAVIARESIAPGHLWRFSFEQLRLAVSETIPWFGAIFAGVYAALYARFASQSNYLAELYNQMQGAIFQSPLKPGAEKDSMAAWQAGFIEDAETLHLATKPLFASVIANMLENGDVREMYINYTPGGESRLKKLERKVNDVVNDIAERHAGS